MGDASLPGILRDRQFLATIDRNVRHSDEERVSQNRGDASPELLGISMTRNFVITLSVLFQNVKNSE
ncbi:hypothetical protein [Cecembia sp.]|uniref:hypothetical protein n=1 Tax=Cecembia sp. TaxID=1898110 RepID=UPI0025C0A5EF|nr:hypothetical protein [Cecembia sp.]